MEMSRKSGYCGCMVGNAVAELGSHDEEIRSILDRCLTRVENALAGCLHQAQQAGEITTDADSRDLARMILITGQGMALVSKIRPGADMARSVPEKHLAGMIAHTPAGRRGQPREVADAYLFLASEQAAFITGAVLSVDGGLVAGT